MTTRLNDLMDVAHLFGIQRTASHSRPTPPRPATPRSALAPIPARALAAPGEFSHLRPKTAPAPARATERRTEELTERRADAFASAVLQAAARASGEKFNSRMIQTPRQHTRFVTADDIMGATKKSGSKMFEGVR
jgi:hypothetical protein